MYILQIDFYHRYEIGSDENQSDLIYYATSLKNVLKDLFFKIRGDFTFDIDTDNIDLNIENEEYQKILEEYASEIGIEFEDNDFEKLESNILLYLIQEYDADEDIYYIFEIPNNSKIKNSEFKLKLKEINFNELTSDKL